MGLILEALKSGERSSVPKAAADVDFADAPPSCPVLAQAALTVVAALALAGAFNYYRTVDKRNNQDPQMTHLIGIQEARFHKVIAMVPPDSVVGYMADLPSRNDAHWPTKGEFIFTAVRYALAPRVLIPYESVRKPDWVLADFANPVDLAQVVREKRLSLVMDFGSGVLLFQSE